MKSKKKDISTGKSAQEELEIAVANNVAQTTNDLAETIRLMAQEARNGEPIDSAAFANIGNLYLNLLELSKEEQ